MAQALHDLLSIPSSIFSALIFFFSHAPTTLHFIPVMSFFFSNRKSITIHAIALSWETEWDYACVLTQSCLTLCDHKDCSPPRLLCPGDFPGKNSGMGCHFLLQRIFPTQGLNPGLPNCRQILYHLNCQGSPNEIIC